MLGATFIRAHCTSPGQRQPNKLLYWQSEAAASSRFSQQRGREKERGPSVAVLTLGHAEA